MACLEPQILQELSNMTRNQPSSACEGARARALTAILLRHSLLVLVLAITPAAQADIVYTWHETDGQAVTGSLDVLPIALTNGAISFADVKSFTFTIPGAEFTTLQTGVFPIAIDSNGVPTGSFPDVTLTDIGANLMVDFSNASFQSSTSSGWSAHDPGGGGGGFWSVSLPAVVPEPSTQILFFIGAVSGVTYVQGRKRWAQRRRGAAGQS
jgi:hypothetical protein